MVLLNNYRNHSNNNYSNKCSTARVSPHKEVLPHLAEPTRQTSRGHSLLSTRTPMPGQAKRGISPKARHFHSI